MFRFYSLFLITGLLLFSGAPVFGVVAPTVPGNPGLEVPAACMKKLMASHETLQRLEFHKAEAQGLEAVAMYPDHPLPHIFMVGVYMYWIQENEAAGIKDKKIFEKFHQVAARTLKMGKEQTKLYPDSAFPWVYRGVALGTRGMVHLYQSNYLKSYYQGKKAARYLRKAVKMDPENRDVYLGLGQFEYYCGRLSGILRFFLGLKGDEAKGIEMMERAAAKGTYSVLPAKAFLSQILVNHHQEWEKAQPYVDNLYRRFPGSHHHVQNAIRLSVGMGLDKDSSKQRLESVFKQWDEGWRPPEYVSLAVDEVRLALAKQYLEENKRNKAKRHLTVLANSADPSLARQAGELKKELSLVKP